MQIMDKCIFAIPGCDICEYFTGGNKKFHEIT